MKPIFEFTQDYLEIFERLADIKGLKPEGPMSKFIGGVIATLEEERLSPEQIRNTILMPLALYKKVWEENNNHEIVGGE